MHTIVYDVDDCLLDTNGYVCDKLGLDIKSFREWGLANLPERDAVLDFYGKEEIYTNSKIYKGVRDIKRIPWDVILHTSCANKACGHAKKSRLERLGFKSSNIILDFNRYKEMLDCIVQVEDCYENLIRSKALYKVLINKPWNERFNIGIRDRTYRVFSLSEANQKIKEILYMHYFDVDKNLLHKGIM